MLKGTMKLELTDVRTGEVETLVEHNIFTNALANIFKPLGFTKGEAKMYETFAPYYQKVLGGILLFDSNIEENVNTLYAPLEAKLVGCAVYDQQNNTTGKMRGSFNQTESELNTTDRYMKYVYDFQTSQANGTISCVALTNAMGGYTSYGSSDAVATANIPLCPQIDDGILQYVYNNSSTKNYYTSANTGDRWTGYTKGVTELLFLIDYEEDAALYFRIDSESSITIVKRRAYLKTVSVLENPRREKPLVEEVTIGSGISLTQTQVSYNYDASSKCLYISPSKGNLAIGETFTINKVDITTWTAENFTVTNTADVRLYAASSRYAYVYDGFVYLRGEPSPYQLYKIEIANPENIIKLEYKGITSIGGYPTFDINGRIYYEDGSSNLCIVDTSTNEVYKAENTRLAPGNYLPSYTPILGNEMYMFVSFGNQNGGFFIMVGNYLATINNLSETVTKTADKTMKVTYIIQEQ